PTLSRAFLPYTTLFRSIARIEQPFCQIEASRLLGREWMQHRRDARRHNGSLAQEVAAEHDVRCPWRLALLDDERGRDDRLFLFEDRKSTRLNSSHVAIS